MFVLVAGWAGDADLVGGGNNLETIRIVALNDFHGNLAPSGFSVPDPEDRARSIRISAGGIEALGAVLAERRRADPETIFVGAGDLIGASPLASSLLGDEPAIEALNALGLQASAIGNHELDAGRGELMRMQNGGCDSNAAERACRFSPRFSGAKFKYLAANIVDESTGKPAFPAYFVTSVRGIQVAFIGAVLRDTPRMLMPASSAGLRFTDEAESINRVVPELRARGIEAIVVLIHQGGETPEGFDQVDCKNLSGDIVEIVKKLDRAIDAVVSGHTHRGYQCRVEGRLVTQAASYGHLLTAVNLKVDRSTRDVVAADSANIVVNADLHAGRGDPALTSLLARARAMTEPIANRPVGVIGVEQLANIVNTDGESPLGRVIADAQLHATKDLGARIALMNPGGIRTRLPANLPNPSKRVTYGDVLAVHPFGNTLTVIEFSGAELKTLLEQQWGKNPARARLLQVSQGFSYAYDPTLAQGERVNAASLRLDGIPIRPLDKVKITVNNFLAGGGDGYGVLKDAAPHANTEILDARALIDYLVDRESLGVPAGSSSGERRIVRIDIARSERVARALDNHSH